MKNKHTDYEDFVKEFKALHDADITNINGTTTMRFENTIDFTNWAYRNFIESRTRNDCILTYGFILKEYYAFIDEHIMRECDKNFLYN